MNNNMIHCVVDNEHLINLEAGNKLVPGPEVVCIWPPRNVSLISLDQRPYEPIEYYGPFTTMM